MKRGTVRLPNSVAVLLFVLGACAAPKVELTDVWKDDAYRGRYFKKVLVISAARKEPMRTFAENEFVAQLVGRGIEAIASHEIIPFGKMRDKAFIAERIKGMGIDGILVTRVLYTLTAAPPLPKQRTWHEFYSGSFGYEHDVSAPRTSQGKTVAHVDVNLYAARDERLLWSASADLPVKGEPRDEIRQFVSEIVRKLHQEELLQ